MPSLLRFMTVLGMLVGIGLGALYALATFVTPRTREMTVTIPAAKLRPAPPAEVTADPVPIPAASAAGARAASADGSATR